MNEFPYGDLPPDASVPELREEITRLKKIITALMNHAERSTTTQHSDFGIFYNALSIEKQVRERTGELENTLHENRKINRALHNTTMRMEAEMEGRRRVERELRQANEALTQLSFQDVLTGIHNRRYFEEFLAREWQRAKRKKNELALILIDVDDFKSYNDAYGHPAGDACLKAVAHVLNKTAKRAADMAARYGGEEFVMVFPDTTAAVALGLAERARKNVAALRIAHRRSSIAARDAVDGGPYVSISLGVASVVPCEPMSSAALIAAADAALYEAKRRGRNQAVVGVAE